LTSAHSAQFDYIQWCIDHSYINDDPSERTVDLITRRFNVIAFAAIQSSVITASNLLLDLAASPLTPSYFATVRDEVEVELGHEGGVWTKQALSNMVSLDSGLRESMRLWGFVSRGVLKEVVAKDGVTMPNGLHLPQGVKVGIHANPIHHDEDIYQDAYSFRPLRFCSSVTGEKLEDDYSKRSVAGQGKRGTSLVTTSSNFMAFSHGRHAWYVQSHHYLYPFNSLYSSLFLVVGVLSIQHKTDKDLALVASLRPNSSSLSSHILHKTTRSNR
jgi:hypothetical protein